MLMCPKEVIMQVKVIGVASCDLCMGNWAFENIKVREQDACIMLQLPIFILCIKLLLCAHSIRCI